MTREDKKIWLMLIRKYGSVMQVLYSYLSGRYWLNQGVGLYSGFGTRYPR